MLERTVARTRIHPRSLMSATAATPDAHTPQSARAPQSRVVCVEGVGAGTLRNGSLTCKIVLETAGAASFCAAGAHSRWLPRLISSENGSRNLQDALNHSQ